MEPSKSPSGGKKEESILNPVLQAMLTARRQERAAFMEQQTTQQHRQPSFDRMQLLQHERLNSTLQMPSIMSFLTPMVPMGTDPMVAAMMASSALQQNQLLQLQAAGPYTQLAALQGNFLGYDAFQSQLVQLQTLQLQQQLLNSSGQSIVTNPLLSGFQLGVPANSQVLLQQRQEGSAQKAAAFAAQATAPSRKTKTRAATETRKRGQRFAASGRLPKRPCALKSDEPCKSKAPSPSPETRHGNLQKEPNSTLAHHVVEADTQASPSVMDRRFRTEAFPVKLLRLIHAAKEQGLQRLIAFTPDGTAVRTSSHFELEELFFPKFFRHQNYASFKRQLSMYGFQRVQLGPNRGAYEHPLFIESRPNLVGYIRRQPEQSLARQGLGAVAGPRR